MIRIARILEGQERRQDDDLEALAVFNVEPSGRINSYQQTCASSGESVRQEDAPVEVVIQNLNRRRPNPSRGLLGHRNEHGWVRFSNDEAFLAFPFEFVSRGRGV